MTHIVNGMAGNIESHSTLDPGQAVSNITAVLDFEHYGFSKLRVINRTAISFSFVKGADGSIGDELTLLKRSEMQQLFGIAMGSASVAVDSIESLNAIH